MAVAWRRGTALALAAALILVAGGARADDYPSWDDVQNARGDEQATQAQIDRIQTALAAAQASAAETSRQAFDAAQAAKTAREQATAATERAKALAEQADTAERNFAALQRSMGALASSRYRTEAATPLAVRLFTSLDPDELLSRLGMLDRLETVWGVLAQQAKTSAATVASLRAQAAQAEQARKDLAEQAERAAQRAQEAADREAAQVAALNDHVGTLYAQLAVLKNTTADVERRYRIGEEIAAQERQRALEEQRARDEQRAREQQQQQNQDPGPAPDPDPGGGGGGSGDVIVDPGAAKDYARGALGWYGWGQDQFWCLEALWNRESSWRADAYNPWSGAYGIPQSLPGDKMAAAGPDWRTNARTQIDWGLGYISNRYGSPCAAWQHSEETNWY